jgi:hypothetical protein
MVSSFSAKAARFMEKSAGQKSALEGHPSLLLSASG